MQKYSKPMLMEPKIDISKKSIDQPVYPGIRNVDRLRYHQLRYRFSDHEFLSLQWKAMKLSGWSYSGGVYKSPKGSLVFENTIEMNAQFDAFAVPAFDIKRTLCRNPQCFNDTILTTEKNVESLQVLRNDICYRMELLIEQHMSDVKQPDALVSGSSTVSSMKDSEDLLPLKHSLALDNEKGANLYLQRKKRAARQNSNQSKRRNALATHLENTGNGFDFNAETSAKADIMSSFNDTICKNIENAHERNDFAKWRFLLSVGHPLLFYGNGSKYDMLMKFHDNHICREGYILQIDGFDADASMNTVLDLLVTQILNGIEPSIGDICCGSNINMFSPHTRVMGSRTCSSSTRSVTKRALAISHALRQNYILTGIPIFLIINSFEHFLSSDIEQEALASLMHCSVPIFTDVGNCFDREIHHCDIMPLHVVASVDNVDATSALLSTTVMSQFSWIWIGVHTCRPFIREMVKISANETKNEMNSHQRRKKVSRLQGKTERVLQVLSNLAPRYGEVMQILAQLQLSEMQKTSQCWVDYKTFRAACKSRFVIDKDSKLRTLQTELSDHHLLLMKTEGTSEYVSIPYSIEKLREILSFQRHIDN